MKRRLLTPLFFSLIPVLALCALLPATAAPDATTNSEVEYLLKFVADSDAQFLRNGDSHKAKDAAGHIRKKYVHYFDKISTTEDFVRLAATKSALSGKVYQVKLKDGTTRPNADWLLAELKRYRAAKAKAPATVTTAGAE